MPRELAPRERLLDVASLPQRAPFRFLTRAWIETDGASTIGGRDEHGGPPCGDRHRESDGETPVAIHGEWTIDGREPFLAGHFPGDPIVPGVLVTEALAQLCGLLPRNDEATGHRPHASMQARAGAAMLVQSEMRFRAVVRPPAVITLRARLDRIVGPMFEFEVDARHDGRLAAEGRLVLRPAPPTETP